jgi:hypothetical protein
MEQRVTSIARPALRVGFLFDSFVQRQWIYRIVEDIKRSSIATPVLVVKNDAPRPRDWRTQVRAAFTKRRQLLRKLYVEADNFLFRAEPDPFKPCDLGPLLGDCSVLHVTPVQTKYCDYFPDDAVHAIRSHRLDVAFRFGFRILQGEALNIAQFGVWSYHHGDNMVVRGGPAGFWEVMLGHHVTGSILQILTSELDAGRVLYRSWASTYKYSVRVNKHNFYWKSSSFVMRKLKDLHEDGPASLEGDTIGSLYWPYSNPLYRAPSNGEMVRLLSRLAFRIARRATRGTFWFGQWALGIKFGKVDGPAESLHNCRLLVPPKDRFWADPFPVARDNKYFIFVEEFLYKTRKGRIAVIEMDEKGAWKEPVPVLETSYHLSYPFVFEWRGAHYMIPETRAQRTIELYRCVTFPLEWKLEKVLVDDIRAVDTTLAEIDGRWWMFTNINVEGATSSDELHLFYADSPLGPWTPHRRNPVKSDVRCSRSAGRLFVHNGGLHRPAQDSSVAYGYAISINKVVCINPDEFREEEVSRILPQWKKGVERNHTLNSAGRLTVVDGFMRRRRLF